MADDDKVRAGWYALVWSRLPSDGVCDARAPSFPHRWRAIAKAVAGHYAKITVVLVESRAAQADRARGFTSQALAVGNEIADTLARRGADFAQLLSDLAQQSVAVEADAKLI